MKPMEKPVRQEVINVCNLLQRYSSRGSDNGLIIP
jgi:hypothetical protein